MAFTDEQEKQILEFITKGAANNGAGEGDNNKIVEMNNASANTFTIPLNSSVAYPVGAQINILQHTQDGFSACVPLDENIIKTKDFDAAVIICCTPVAVLFKLLASKPWL